jgi:K+-transporting ATPase KdpF subunit
MWETLNMENVLVGIVAVGLLAYLFVALIRPEKF